MSKERKWLIGIIVLLLLMNMTILAFFWFGKRPPNPNKINKHFVKELNLSESQAATFETLIETHLAESKTLMDSLKIHKEGLLEILVQPNKDELELDKVIKKIGTLESEKANALVQHFITLEKACNSDEQREQLRKIFKQSLPKRGHRPK